MKLQLDHVVQHAPGKKYAGGLLAVSVLALICGWLLLEMRAEHSALDKELTQMHEASQPAPVAVIQPQALSSVQKTEIREANRVLDELGRPWPALLTRLEQAAKPEIALLAIRPDAAKGKLRLKGEAKDIAALLGYVQRLEAVPEMHDVVLDEHEMMEKPQDGGMAHFIRFGITARWGAT